MPPDPPREVPPSAVALSVPKKNPTFSQILIGSTDGKCVIAFSFLLPLVTFILDLQFLGEILTCYYPHVYMRIANYHQICIFVFDASWNMVVTQSILWFLLTMYFSSKSRYPDVMGPLLLKCEF